MNAKPLWKSKTLWFNAAVLVLAAAETQLHVLSGVLPATLYAGLAFLVPLVNVALRFGQVAILTPTTADAQAINAGAAAATAPTPAPTADPAPSP